MYAQNTLYPLTLHQGKPLKKNRTSCQWITIKIWSQIGSIANSIW